MMSADDWATLEEVCHAALALPLDERQAFVRDACGSNSALLAEVESLLAEESGAVEFLSRPAAAVVGAELLEHARGSLSGLRLGPYQIGPLLGVGGMGDVYRALDHTLGRDVALKALPSALTGDPQWRARFEREARVLASLNHPHIGTIFGVQDDYVSGQADDGISGSRMRVRALVLELVDGDTLAERLARTTAVPIGEALAVARQIADALEAAHDKHIVHCDLKPANIKITPAGVVKVLDFGLAHATLGDPSSSQQTATRHASPFGTAAYMSPEQARGETPDKRTDVWAFGCVLYEMLTGRMAFSGETISETLARVRDREPDWSALPGATPAPVRRLLRRCLAKDPKQRVRDIRDIKIDIDAIDESPRDAGSTGEQPPGYSRRRAVVRVWIPLGAVALALGLMRWAPWTTPPALFAPVRLNAELGANVSLEHSIAFGFGDTATLSPDGTRVAFVASNTGADGPPQLFVRTLDELDASALAGTEDALAPFFSPEGDWIGFFAGNQLKRVRSTGGAVDTIADALSPRGGAWGVDGTIVFSPNSAPGTRLLRVSAAGGRAVPVMPLGKAEALQSWPQLLPGGAAILYTSTTSSGSFDNASLVVQPLPTGTPRTVYHGGYHGRYLPSGHLVYINNGTLFAVRFALGRMEVIGQPAPVLEGVRSNSITGGSQFAVAENGTLVYLSGPSIGGGTPLSLIDRHGRTTPMRFPPANWFEVVFSPDGTRLAMQIRGETADIWIYDLSRETLMRVTQDPGADSPLWTPDGAGIVFSSRRADTINPNLYWQRSDGTGDAVRLTTSTSWHRPTSWHPSGNVLAFEEVQDSHVQIVMLPMKGSTAAGFTPGTRWPFSHSSFNESAPMFSPDGRWIAYASNESGRQEVYVRPFPGPGGKWQVSTEGGTHPIWSRTKHELLYGLDGQIMTVDFEADGDTFRSGKPRQWFDTRYQARGPRRMFDLHPDGERMVLAPVAPTASADANPGTVVFMFNFFDYLRVILPTTQE